VLYQVTALHARRQGEIPQVLTEGAARQDVVLEPHVSFERACPEHLEILGGLDGLWCPHGRNGHSVMPPVATDPDAAAAFATTLLWKLVAIREGRAPRTAARVYGARVEWATWFVNRYPDAVAQVHGRDGEGFAASRLAAGSLGFKRLYRMRQRGLDYKAARAEAERWALARLAVALERMQERKTA
jgi:hypothetical protein